MKYFVSADIHGFFNEWQKALKEKGFEENNPNHKLIICGDLFDRGRQVKEIVEYVLVHMDRIILIRGNHEDLLEEMIYRNYPCFADEKNGTFQTMLDLYDSYNFSNDNMSMIELASVVHLQEILNMCRDYFETEHYIFVHAFIPLDFNGEYDKYWRYASKNRFQSARWINPVLMYQKNIFEPGKTIVCGHWHCSAFWHEYDKDKYDEFGKRARFDSFISEHIIAIDGCTIYSNIVNVLVIDD